MDVLALVDPAYGLGHSGEFVLRFWDAGFGGHHQTAAYSFGELCSPVERFGMVHSSVSHERVWAHR